MHSIVYRFGVFAAVFVANVALAQAQPFVACPQPPTTRCPAQQILRCEGGQWVCANLPHPPVPFARSVNPESAHLLQALVGSGRDGVNFLASGNQITSATYEVIAGDDASTTRYTLSNRRCSTSSCVGGTQLQIDVTPQPGAVPAYRFQSRLTPVP